MFTFQAQDNPIHNIPKGRISSIPDPIQPAKLFSLPPLHFTLEASQPISDLSPIEDQSKIIKYKHLLESSN